MWQKEKSQLDLRVKLLLACISTIGIAVFREEKSYMLAFTAAVLFLIIQKAYGRTVVYVLSYLALLGLSRLIIGVSGLQTIWIFANVTRHMLIPLAFLSGLRDSGTGEILATFEKMRLPKAFGISSVVLLRFVPSIRMELRFIRHALKFRGVGASLAHTLFHIPLNFKLTLIPLLIRTVRISEEMTAAAMVRGVEINNKITSFHEVRWKPKDTVVAGVFTLLLMIPIALSFFEVKL